MEPMKGNPDEKDLLAMALLVAQPTLAAADIEKDKALHAVAGVAVSQAFGFYAENNGKDRVTWGCGGAVAAGLAKELYDATGRGDVEFADFAATASSVAGRRVKQYVAKPKVEVLQVLRNSPPHCGRLTVTPQHSAARPRQDVCRRPSSA